jgi:hypothetical protein
VDERVSGPEGPVQEADGRVLPGVYEEREMNWKAVVGKVLPWAVGSVTGLLTALGLSVSWWPTAGALLIGAVQLVLSMIPEKVKP